ncbi:hypothetical protein ACLMJK_008987 [Lecanora helva]
MSKAFLEKLLNPDNKVKSPPDPLCQICMQPYESKTGSNEYPVALACKHVFGSACILAWSDKSHTCPMCRTEMYPKPPQPAYIIPEARDDDLPGLVNCFAQRLALSPQTADFTIDMAKLLWRRSTWNQRHNMPTTAAVAIYMSTHVSDQPRSLRRMTWATDIPQDGIRAAYRRCFDYREELVTESLLNMCGVWSADRLVSTLPVPGTEDGAVNANQVKSGRKVNYGESCRSSELERLCTKSCTALRCEGLVKDMALIIHETLSEYFRDGRSSKIYVALAVFFACNINRTPVTFKKVSTVVGVNYEDLISAYRVVYPGREGLVDEELTKIMAHQATKKIHQILSPLTWPSL